MGKEFFFPFSNATNFPLYTTQIKGQTFYSEILLHRNKLSIFVATISAHINALAFDAIYV